MYSIHYRDRRRQARQEEVVLSQGIEISDPPGDSPTAPSPASQQTGHPIDLQCPGPQVPAATQHGRPVPRPDQVPAQDALAPDDAIPAQDHTPSRNCPGPSPVPLRFDPGATKPDPPASHSPVPGTGVH